MEEDLGLGQYVRECLFGIKQRKDNRSRNLRERRLLSLNESPVKTEKERLSSSKKEEKKLDYREIRNSIHNNARKALRKSIIKTEGNI